MQRMFLPVLTVLSLSSFEANLEAQSAPPAFSFSAPQKITTGAANQAGLVVSIQAVDLNGDGNTDLYAQQGTSGSAAFQNLFLAGDGKGGFVLNANSNTNNPGSVNPFFAYDPSGPFNPPALFVDLNGDGKADTIYIDPGSFNGAVCPPTDRAGSLNSYPGDGTGDFAPLTPLSYSIPLNTPFTSENLTTGDFNHDGLEDVVMLTNLDPLTGCGETSGTTNTLLLLNNGDGTFAPSAFYRSNTQISWGSKRPVTGDFNGDGNLDMAFLGRAAANGAYPPATGNVIQVIYGYGDGTATIGPIYTVDSAVDDIQAADLNGDGKTDVVVLTEPKTPGAAYRIVTLLAKQAGGFYWASQLTSSNPVTLIGLMI
jgi:FG-GAP-like repeat